MSIQTIHVSLEIWGFIFCLIMALCVFLGRNFEPEKRRLHFTMQLTVAVLLLMDAFAWYFRGKPGDIAYYMVRISNFMVFLIGDIMLLLYHRYICRLFYPESLARSPLRVRMVYGIGVTGCLLVVLSRILHFYYYFDAGNFYHRGKFYYVSVLIPLAGMLLDLSLLIENRKKVERYIWISLVTYVALPMLAAFLLLFVYGISFGNIAITISVINMFVVAMVEQSRELGRREREMYELRAQMMLSQIQPHFLYNTLSTIRYLCRKDPELAAETVDEFSIYLRGNLDALSRTKQIPFSKELEHVRSYLAIEQKRFGDRIRVEYDLQEQDFLLPALTVQPLIENAVKHGITRKEEGGSIRIATCKEGSIYRIEIKDDGVGFDADTFSKKEKRFEKSDEMHVGIQNVRNRLRIMCGGTLQITSRPDAGTCVQIRIPERHVQGGREYENIDR